MYHCIFHFIIIRIGNGQSLPYYNINFPLCLREYFDSGQHNHFQSDALKSVLDDPTVAVAASNTESWAHSSTGGVIQHPQTAS